MKRGIGIGLAVLLAPLGCRAGEATAEETKTEAQSAEAREALPKTKAEWKRRLTPMQFHVLREKGTEHAFTGPYWNSHEKAEYVCAGCGARLFSSDHKFDSGTGWPSFFKPVRKGAVAEKRDRSHGMERVEVVCPRCGGHLGHVFNDGPAPTGQRFCINGAALKQVKDAPAPEPKN